MNAYDLFTFYLEPDDLQGKSIPAVVSRVVVEQVFNPGTKKKEPKPIMYFVGKKKAVSINKTRAAAMMRITGSAEFEQWSGAKVILTAGEQSGKKTIIISAPDETPGELKPSRHTTIEELTGERQTNPDPVSDTTWGTYTDTVRRADAVQIPHSDVSRDKTTESDLQAYLAELIPFVRDAEE